MEKKAYNQPSIELYCNDILIYLFHFFETVLNVVIICSVKVW